MYSDISTDPQIQEFAKELSKISFKGFEYMDVGIMLSVPLFEYSGLGNPVKKAIGELTLGLLNYKYEFNMDKNASILFFYSSTYLYNSAYRKMYNSVKETVDSKITLEVVKNKKINSFYPKYIHLYYQWIRQMKIMKTDNKAKKYAVLYMLKAYIELQVVKKYITDNVKAIVTFCDVHLVDNVVTQYANHRGIKTVTLQHGHFNAKDRGWVFKNSLSEYFLAHGQYAVNEAIKSGAPKEKFISIGMMNFINNKFEISNQKNGGRFAVVLNGPGAKEDNESFIELANFLGKTYNIKYITRSHPAYNIDMYKNILDARYWEKECDRGISIPDFSRMVDFTLVGSSTVFIELLYLEQIVFRFTGTSQDIYEDISWCAFSNAEELQHLYQKYIVDDNNDLSKKVIESKNNLCQPGNIAENYKLFFKSIL